MNKSESIIKLSVALIKAQSEILNPEATASNPHFKSKYASLASTIDATKPILAKNGLTIVQLPTIKENMVMVETMLLHVSGEYLISEVMMPVGKKDSQGVMSATTYARRSGWSSMCGVSQADEDDDGNKSSGGDFVITDLLTAIGTGNKQLAHDTWVALDKIEQKKYWKMLDTNQGAFNQLMNEPEKKAVSVDEGTVVSTQDKKVNKK